MKYFNCFVLIILLIWTFLWILPKFYDLLMITGAWRAAEIGTFLGLSTQAVFVGFGLVFFIKKVFGRKTN